MKLRTTVKICALLIFIFSSSVKAQQNLKITKKPISFDTERIKLSLEYLKSRYGIEKKIPTITPKIIILHWTGGNSFSAAFNTFNRTTLNPTRRDLASVSKLNVSAHYLVDREGAIYQLLPDTVFARHTIGLNYCAIGIENVGSANFPLTEKQVLANEQLVRLLKQKYDIEYLIGHYEYTQFKGSSLWKEVNNNYHTEKFDPGINFMKRVRADLEDLDLKGAPKQLAEVATWRK